MVLIDELLKNINDPLTVEEYAKRTESFKENLIKFIEMMVSYNMKPGFIEFEVKRCIGIGGFPTHDRFLRDVKNLSLASGINNDVVYEQIKRAYHNFFGETIYAEDIQRPIGESDRPNIPRQETTDEKHTATASFDILTTPVDTTDTYKYLPYQPEITLKTEPTKERMIHFELRFNEGVNPKKINIIIEE